MTLAIGGSSAPAKPPHGGLWVDVRDYGAKADNGATDNSIPFQAAIDDLIAKMVYPTTTKGTVFIPSAPLPYGVAETIWVDAQNIEIQGEGWGSYVGMTNRHSTFLFGVRRTEYQTVNSVRTALNINSSNRPDLYGKLDNSAVSTPGTRWGIRTNGNSFVQVQASPLSAGPSSVLGQYISDYWTESTQLTIEFCIEPPDGQQFPINVPLLGMGLIAYEPSPFTISMWDTPTKVLVMFRTSDIGPGKSAPNRYFAFDLGTATPPFRIAVQFDLVNAVCSAFVNGTQVGFVYSQNMSANSSPPFRPNSGLTFQPNERYPFMIGADNVHGPYYNVTGIDLRLYGLRVSNTLRYQTNGVGQPQKRVDVPNAPISDAYAYFANDSHTVCFLPGTDNPATAGRIVTVKHGGASAAGPSSGLFMHTPNSGGITGNAIRDIQVVSGAGYGMAIALGGVLEMIIQNVKAVNGFQAIGSFNTYACYNIYIYNCWLEGFDSCYCGFTHLTIAREIVCGRAGRDAIRHFGGSGHWDNVFVAFPNPNTDTVVKIGTEEYGGNFTFTNLNVDFEGESVGLAMIYCEAIAESSGTSLRLRDVLLGTVGAGSPLVMLKDVSTLGGEFNRCWIDVENLQAFTNTYLAVIDIEGPLWYGEVRGVALNGPQFNHRQVFGKNTNVVIRDTKYIGPPRQYLWYNGAHALEVRSPADGQFSQWRCVATGTYGTPTPPTWLGLNPISVSPNGLAAYAIFNGYMTAALS
jgi:hypothetical protein